MASSPIFFSIFSFFLLFLPVIASESTVTVVCQTLTCSSNGPQIRFPFRITEAQGEQCGYEGFEVSCDGRNRTILHLAEAGDFVVDTIDYADQYILLKSPDDCLQTGRLEDQFMSSLSPFVAPSYVEVTIANCSSMNSSTTGPGISVLRLDCPGLAPDTVVVVVTDIFAAKSWLWEHACSVSTILSPSRWPHPMNINESFWLRWFEPDCRSCEAAKGRCGLEFFQGGSKVVCIRKHGLSKTARFAIAALFTLPWFACIFGFMWFLKVRVFVRRGLDQIGSSWVPGPAPLDAIHREDVGAARRNDVGVTGISSPTIESYPKTRIEDLGQLPRPNNDVCAICLSKYEQLEMIRTIPECEHYFHACCIDQWLRKNASCPLCRNYKVDIKTEATSNP